MPTKGEIRGQIKKAGIAGEKNNLRAPAQVVFGLHFTESPLSSWPWQNPGGAERAHHAQNGFHGRGDVSNKGTKAALMTPANCIHPRREGRCQGG